MINSTSISISPFGTVNGKSVELYSLTNSQGTQVKLCTYGGTITSWTIRQSDGSDLPIILGFDSLEEYLSQTFYLGATIGRYANLIAEASFELEGSTYKLSRNHRNHHLHGGANGFDKKIWDATIIANNPPTITLSKMSRHLEEGYPGNLEVDITFQLTNDNELIISYRCQTDRPTPVNLTNHMYFNLNGDFENDITNHSLMINSDLITPSHNGITTGELLDVTGTPFDFRTTSHLAPGIKALGGYNHNFLLNKAPTGQLNPAAVLSSANGSRLLKVNTTEPALQFYTGNSLSGDFRDRSGAAIRKFHGLCLETQKTPNSPNHSHFPSTILHPGEVYSYTTSYKISI